MLPVPLLGAFKFCILIYLWIHELSNWIQISPVHAYEFMLVARDRGQKTCKPSEKTHPGGLQDHTEYMVPSSFIWIPAMFVSHGPTPAGWPTGGTLSSVGRPCLSGASWPALLKVASVLSHEARRGVSGFGSFCRNKRASAAGPTPGNTENQGDRRVEPTRATH